MAKYGKHVRYYKRAQRHKIGSPERASHAAHYRYKTESGLKRTANRSFITRAWRSFKHG